MTITVIVAKPAVWMPTRIHPVATKLAFQLFDVITPLDPRAKRWPELCSAAVVRTGKITAEEIERTEGRLKIITRNGVGYDMIPMDLCKKMGIVVTNLPGSNKKAVAELTLAIACSLVRRVTEFDRRLRRGEVLPSIDWMANSLDEQVLGLVGMGEIAYETAKRFLGAFETPILVYSPTSSPLKWTPQDPSGQKPIPHTRVDSLEELLRRSDVVSLHCPLMESTENLMSTEQFRLMKKTAVLLNTARGGLVDESALLHALKTREIAGAGLDVLVSEPASLEVYHELFSLENVVVMPHAGGGTEQVQIDSCVRAVLTADKFLKGEGVYGSNVLCGTL